MMQSTTARRQHYSGDGSTLAFVVPFFFQNAADIGVVIRTLATGAEVEKTNGVDFTVAGGGDQPSTGTVTMVTAPTAAEQILIYGRAPATQDNDWRGANAVPAGANETQADQFAIVLQELYDGLGRCLKWPRTESALRDAELPPFLGQAGYLGIGADGLLAWFAAALGTVGVSTFVNSLLSAADAQAFRGLIGLPCKLAVAHRNGVDQSGFGDATWLKMLNDAELIDTHGCYDTANSRFLPGVAGKTLVLGRVAWTTPEAEAMLGVHLGKNDALYTGSMAAALVRAKGVTFEGAFIAGVIDHAANDSLCVFGYQDSPTAGYARTANGAASQTGAIYLTFLS